MKPIFADTFYFLALLNSKDASHAQAWKFSKSWDVPLVTTILVLTEVANTLARSAKRQVFRQLVKDVEKTRQTGSLPNRRVSLSEASNSMTRVPISSGR